MKTTINTDQELYVIDHGSHVSCLGFDVLAERDAAYRQFAGLPASMAPRGSDDAWRSYEESLVAAQAHAAAGARCYAFTNEKLRPFRGQRVRVSNPYETLTGRKVSTFIVGQTTGWAPATLFIRDRRQRGSADIIPPTYDPGHIVLA